MVPIHTLDSVDQYSILINSTFIHRFGMSGGMVGGARRGGGSCESVCKMVFTLLDVQLLGTLSILGILTQAIFFLLVT